MTQKITNLKFSSFTTTAQKLSLRVLDRNIRKLSLLETVCKNLV